MYVLCLVLHPLLVGQEEEGNNYQTTHCFAISPTRSVLASDPTHDATTTDDNDNQPNLAPNPPAITTTRSIGRLIGFSIVLVACLLLSQHLPHNRAFPRTRSETSCCCLVVVCPASHPFWSLVEKTSSPIMANYASVAWYLISMLQCSISLSFQYSMVIIHPWSMWRYSLR